MNDNWKPGDVALIEAGCHANRRVAVRTGVPTNMGWAYSDVVDGKSRANWTADSHGTVSVVRRLVVIDPESEDDVTRLADALVDHHSRAYGVESDWLSIQAALREFANPTPPKPEEPTGLGAVVEDADGLHWVRVEPFNPTNSAHIIAWRSRVAQAAPKEFSWPNVKAVRVLSEGVTA